MCLVLCCYSVSSLVSMCISYKSDKPVLVCALYSWFSVVVALKQCYYNHYSLSQRVVFCCCVGLLFFCLCVCFPKAWNSWVLVQLLLSQLRLLEDMYWNFMLFVYSHWSGIEASLIRDWYTHQSSNGNSYILTVHNHFWNVKNKWKLRLLLEIWRIDLSNLLQFY